MIANFRLYLAALIFIAGGLGGCARPALVGQQAQIARSLAADTNEYSMGVGDKVRILVYNEEALSGEFQVGANGAISFPLIGDVPAANRTPPQVAAEIRGLLADGYLRDPKVSLEVITYRPFFILGEVKLPGQYPFQNGLTVMNAVATAQGATPRADMKVVFIRRSGDAQEQPYRLTPDLRVYPGDTIRIGERFF